MWLDKLPPLAPHQVHRRQASKLSRSINVAKAISRVTNPCFLSVVVLVLIAYTNSTEIWSTVSHVAVIALGLVLLPISYVLIRMARRGSRAERLGDLVDFLKEHPKDVGALGIVFGLPCTVLLVFLDAPSFLIATLTSLLICSLLIALVRELYKVSYHLAGITCLIIMVAVIWEPLLAATAVSIPMIVWARYLLREHTLGQMVTGSVLGVIVTVIVLYGFGLW
ncbi:MAG TPA: hypothetical protein G4O10_02560 [Dehalococcoidia bacterium]|nr:hypothetical protein [Dehalococcoidia bacterium]